MAHSKRLELPPGFREGHSGDLACPHRDVSCCPFCAGTYEEIVEVYGQHFWVPDETERASLKAQMSDDYSREERLADQDADAAYDRDREVAP